MKLSAGMTLPPIPRASTADVPSTVRARLLRQVDVQRAGVGKVIGRHLVGRDGSRVGPHIVPAPAEENRPGGPGRRQPKYGCRARTRLTKSDGRIDGDSLKQVHHRDTALPALPAYLTYPPYLTYATYQTHQPPTLG